MPPHSCFWLSGDRLLRTTSIDGIGRPGIHRIWMALIVWNCDLSRSSGAITVRVSYLEGDRIDATVTAAVTIRPELHRLTIGCNHNVAARGGAFITTDLRNYHAVEIHT